MSNVMRCVVGYCGDRFKYVHSKTILRLGKKILHAALSVFIPLCTHLHTPSIKLITRLI